MSKEIAYAIFGFLAGISIGYSIGEQRGWWECFKSFEKHRKKRL
jgi:hypothetical protein